MPNADREGKNWNKFNFWRRTKRIHWPRTIPHAFPIVKMPYLANSELTTEIRFTHENGMFKLQIIATFRNKCGTLIMQFPDAPDPFSLFTTFKNSALSFFEDFSKRKTSLQIFVYIVSPSYIICIIIFQLKKSS
jgi:hypothetical protein